jgi:hypothetical protein
MMDDRSGTEPWIFFTQEQGGSLVNWGNAFFFELETIWCLKVRGYYCYLGEFGGEWRGVVEVGRERAAREWEEVGMVRGRRRRRLMFE